MITSGVALSAVSVSGRSPPSAPLRQRRVGGKRIGAGCGDDQGAQGEPDHGPDQRGEDRPHHAACAGASCRPPIMRPSSSALAAPACRSPAIRPAAEHENAIRERQHLVELGRDQQDAPCRRRAAAAARRAPARSRRRRRRGSAGRPAARSAPARERGRGRASARCRRTAARPASRIDAARMSKASTSRRAWRSIAARSSMPARLKGGLSKRSSTRLSATAKSRRSARP